MQLHIGKTAVFDDFLNLGIVPIDKDPDEINKGWQSCHDLPGLFRFDVRGAAFHKNKPKGIDSGT